MKQGLWLMAVCALYASWAQAAEYKGIGYSFIYPDDWTIASSAMKGKIERETNSRLNAPADMDAMLFGPDQSTNILVIVKNGTVPVDEGSLQNAKEEFLKGVRSSGVEPSIRSFEIVTANGRNFYLCKSDNSIDGEVLRQWSLMGSAGGKFYIFTFTAEQQGASHWEPVFDNVVQSVKLEGGPLEWLTEMPIAVRLGIVGGVVGGLIGLIKWLVRKPPARVEIANPYAMQTPLPPQSLIYQPPQKAPSPTQPRDGQS